MPEQTLVSEMPSVVFKEEDSLPDIGSLSLNKEGVMIDYYLLEENSEGEEKIVLLKSFTPEEEKHYIQEYASGKEAPDTSVKFSEASKSDSNCSSSALPPSTTSVEPVAENGGYDTEDEVSPDILPIDNYLVAGVAAEVLSEYENRPYKPLYKPEHIQEFKAFQPTYQQQSTENSCPSGVNFPYGFSTPPRQSFPMQFQQNNYCQTPTPVTPLYTPFPSSTEYYSMGEPIPSTPFTYHVPSSPIIPMSAGFSFQQQVPTMVPSSNGFVPGFASYSPPTPPWINKLNPVDANLSYGKSNILPSAPVTSGPCHCISCLPSLPNFEMASMLPSPSQPWISYPYSPMHPMQFLPDQQPQPGQQIFITPVEPVPSQPNFSFQFNAAATEYKPPNYYRQNSNKFRNKNVDINNNSIKKGSSRPKLWKMSRWSDEVEKEEQELKESNNSSGDSGVEIETEEHASSESSSTELLSSETSISSSISVDEDTQKNQGTQCQSNFDSTDCEDSQILTWVPNMYLAMMDGKISEKAPECFRVRETDFTLIDYGHTFYCMGEELPFVCNSGQARFRNQVVSSAELKYQYYVPPMVDNYDFFGGQQNLWQIKMMHYFSRFTPTLWRLQALPEVVHHKQKGWIHYSIISKLRFCCRTCHRPWTTMRGKIMFTFCLDSGFSVGFVFMKIFGQVCMQQECNDRDFQTAANYPEEIDRIMKKLSHYIGHIYYNMPLSIDYYDQNNSPIRGGNPKSLHRRELCQACFQGMCSKS